MLSVCATHARARRLAPLARSPAPRDALGSAAAPSAEWAIPIRLLKGLYPFACYIYIWALVVSAEGVFARGGRRCRRSGGMQRQHQHHKGSSREERPHARRAAWPCRIRAQALLRAPTSARARSNTRHAAAADSTPMRSARLATLLCIPHRVELRGRGAARQAHHVARAAPRHHLPCSGYQPRLQMLLSFHLRGSCDQDFTDYGHACDNGDKGTMEII